MRDIRRARSPTVLSSGALIKRKGHRGIHRLRIAVQAGRMNKSHTTQAPVTQPVTAETNEAAKHRRFITKTLAKKHFCTLATTSPAGRPHSAGVVYEWVDGSVWIHAMASSRKARNIKASGFAAITVPFRRLPAGPPFTIHFQARAEIVELDDLDALQLVSAGALKEISGHGAMDEPDGCFLRVRPSGTIHSYGPGARVVDLIRDPLHNGSGQVPVGAIT